MSALFSILCLTTQLTFIFAAVTPVEKCALSDSACIQRAAQSFVPEFAGGIPELNVDPVDIMHIDVINFELAGLMLDLKDVDIKGHKKAFIDKLSVDMSKKQIRVVYHVDVVLKSKYKAGGRLLILPISGDGDATFKLKHLKIDMTMPFEVTKDSNGKDVITLSSYKYKYDVKDGAHYQLTNLFNGNKQLSDTMLTFMNENWKTLTTEFGGPIVDATLKRIFAAIKNYLITQPLEDITVQ